ncbi:TetR/AcrR family transcriptional regulator [Magnetospira sp. QH-2]|uniref:TetR/AcrR family transcriptional regulator n=1 Tax=Magnetospira sp. (strain QH-2) TaxID=1288970 RepID=UPI0003E81ADF|nr:TetR/AcrR family transcriptional regulator [Magnetospira sp. QH-2]CCQ73231.1 Putative transcriptional regulator, TetR family [Magnetospira sp. QH-2]
MPRKGEETRTRIVDTANDLFYKQGFHQTSFAHIAEATGIPKGNFYFYFRSKDDLLKSVLVARTDRLRNLLESWADEYPDPLTRLDRMANILPEEMGDVSRYGCPVGSLVAELGKAEPDLKEPANAMFKLLIDWATAQFSELVGAEQAPVLARRLVARMQGMAMLSHSFGDDSWIEDETADIRAWLRQVTSP